MKTGFVCSAFDLCHAGHLLMLEECSKHCVKLTVGLHTDPTIERPEKIKPILDVKERYEILSAIKYIDKIITYTTEKELLSIIIDTSPDIRLLGDDYKVRFDYTGCGLCPEVHYFDRSHGWSTTRFKNLIYKQMKPKGEKNEI